MSNAIQRARLPIEHPRLFVVSSGPAKKEGMGASARKHAVRETPAAARPYRGLFLVPETGVGAVRPMAMSGLMQAQRIVEQVEREIAARVDRERQQRLGLRLVTADAVVEPETLWARVRRAFRF